MSPHLRESVVVLPLKALLLRVAKFDLVLEQVPLHAVHAKQTMLTRMVLFTCDTCGERFPAFHPAYEPPQDLKLELLKRGPCGVAACNIEVAEWNELPAFDPPEVDLLVAEQHSGECRRCDMDVQTERLRQGLGADDAVVAKFSERNHMDPVWMFPREELATLFESATLTESMFVALGHMQVCFVTARRTGLTKVRKNVISFAQDTPAFAQRVGLMCRYEVGDRVNSRLGPGVALDTTEGRLKHLVGASDEERRLLVADESGLLVWPATVKEVRASGQLLLTYDHGFGEGLVEVTHLLPRVRMPWHPRFLKGVYTLMLRRNLGRGRVLEGLELRWGLVSNITR